MEEEGKKGRNRKEVGRHSQPSHCGLSFVNVRSRIIQVVVTSFTLLCPLFV